MKTVKTNAGDTNKMIMEWNCDYLNKTNSLEALSPWLSEGACLLMVSASLNSKTDQCLALSIIVVFANITLWRLMCWSSQRLSGRLRRSCICLKFSQDSTWLYISLFDLECYLTRVMRFLSVLPI
jgi:hypothetical protein